MTTTIRTADGVRLRTSSARRFVLFAIADDSTASPVYRTDDLARAVARFNTDRRRGRYCRVLIVDTTAHRIGADSADAR